jgi:glycyl-tRNA synthetase beta chain
MSASETTSLLLEIGCEEIPARFLENAERDLGRLLLQSLKQSHLLPEVSASSSPDIHTYSTPRRLTVHVPRMLACQPEQSEQISGPPVSAAFDAQGKPTQAAEGFAAKYGVSIDQLERTKTAKGEYLVFQRINPGKHAKELLQVLLPSLIGGLSFPKTMYWTSKAGLRFARPIRWIVALLGEGDERQIVPFEVAGVKSGDETFGHRTQGPGTVKVRGFEDYARELRQRGVVFDPESRREWIQLTTKASLEVVDFDSILSACRAARSPLREAELDSRLEELRSRVRALPKGTERRLVQDRSLENWHVNSTEWPQALVGSFDSRFLQLPREILITVMRDHQKYFAVEDRAGNLQPYFTAVLNTHPDAGGLIRRGHERVLAARFSDAEFFWTSDQKIPLKDRLPMLERVAYHDKLGTYADKVRRTKMVAEEVCEELANSGRMTAQERQHALGAVDLCKCDLTTQMVQEFTELQGVIGGLYAKVQGEPKEVAGAIYDHYRPLSFDDACPRSTAGAVVSLADKLDSVVSGFSVGLEPTGSSDPFGLRRAGNGVVKVAAEKLPGLRLDRLPHSNLTPALAAASRGDLEKRVRAFLRERVEYYLREAAGLRYDTTRAVMSSVLGWSDPSDAVLRGNALEQIIDSPDYAALSQAAKRIRNILSKSASEYDAGIRNPRPELISEPEEQELYRAFESIRGRLLELEAKHEYGSAFLELAGLRQPVDQFFDRVLVMVEQEEIRTNRLALLDAINAHAFSRLADLSEIAVV